MSFEKIRNTLPGFKPQWDARMGAEQLYKAYRSSGLTLDEFEGPRYQRIGHINKLLADGILDAGLRHWRPRRKSIMNDERSLQERLVTADIGEAMFAFASEIYPICRSITGDGVRQTLDAVARHIKLEIHEVPTGTAVFDWVIPREWNIRDAYIKNERGEKIVDFARSNLHVMSYSVPVRRRISLAELKQHVYTLPGSAGPDPLSNVLLR